MTDSGAAPVNSFVVGMSEAATASGADGSSSGAEEAIQHPDYEKARDNLQSALDDHAKKIADDPNLDVGAKSRNLSTLWSRAGEASAALDKEYQQRLEESVETAEARVFFTPKPERDSTRQAYSALVQEVDFAAKLGEGVGEAHAAVDEALARAQRTNDKPLARAAFHVATERGWADLRDRYLETSPERKEAWKEYTRRRHVLENWVNPQERAFGHIDGTRGLRKSPEMRQ